MPVQFITSAERLLTLSHELRTPARVLLFADREKTGTEFARIKLALKFDELAAGKKFNSIYENWPLTRLVREIY